MTLAEIEEATRLKELSLEIALEMSIAHDLASDGLEDIFKMAKEIYKYLSDLDDRTIRIEKNERSKN